MHEIHYWRGNGDISAIAVVLRDGARVEMQEGSKAEVMEFVGWASNKFRVAPVEHPDGVLPDVSLTELLAEVA